MKSYLTDLVLIIGLMLVFYPWLFGVPIGWVWYCLALFGLILVGIVGYDAQAGMWGLGHPGEKMLRTWFDKAKKLLRK